MNGIYYVESAYIYDNLPRNMGLIDRDIVWGLRVFDTQGERFVLYYHFPEWYDQYIIHKYIQLNKLSLSWEHIYHLTEEYSYHTRNISKVYMENNIFFVYYRKKKIYLNIGTWGKVDLVKYFKEKCISWWEVKLIDYVFNSERSPNSDLDTELDLWFQDNILFIWESLEELLILQAQQEWKTLTLEQAKEIAKDWHFGGVR